MWNSDHILIIFFQLSYGNCLLVIYFLILGEAHFMCGGGSQFCLSDM